MRIDTGLESAKAGRNHGLVVSRQESSLSTPHTPYTAAAGQDGLSQDSAAVVAEGMDTVLLLPFQPAMEYATASDLYSANDLAVQPKLMGNRTMVFAAGWACSAHSFLVHRHTCHSAPAEMPAPRSHDLRQKAMFATVSWTARHHHSACQPNPSCLFPARRPSPTPICACDSLPLGGVLRVRTIRTRRAVDVLPVRPCVRDGGRQRTVYRF